ncbi:MAG: type transport system permease protein, partial [Actinomycetota bacterium]|nr:type transport system permease protein [Actinomycetota bacterium]MDQ1563859.1 type transport system permease protein [Actinomycetota bacterium]
MTIPAAPTPTRIASAHQSGRPKVRVVGLSFGGILVSELIKLWTLRSTVWCCAIVLALAFGIGLLAAGFAGSQPGTIPGAAQQSQAVTVATIGVIFGQLVLSVLGVLVISGEYGTGMIRSTLAAVPKRIPALLGKAIVLAVTSLALGLVTIYGTALLQLPFLSNAGIHTNFADPKLNLALLGGVAYLALIALMSFGIGAIIRNSAGGIATALGLLLVLPTVLQIFAAVTQATWVQNVAEFLPTNAGGHLFTYASTASTSATGVISLNATEGGLVLVAWAVVAIAVAALLLRRRDA